jgi:DNA modification methylase
MNPLFQAQENAITDGQVECLGITFPNDEARRQYFLEKLREKLKDPEFRKVEGFPIGEDEDILALSDPPYYTACPNPFLDDFMGQHGTKYTAHTEYHQEPFTTDISEGKNDPLYTAHSYHTKVPHKAIMRYILHYTEPGDIVFDGFCGTGMTGVAAQLCGNRQEIAELGYHVTDKGQITLEVQHSSGKSGNVPISKLGARRAILNDLSPAATFIAANYGSPVDIHAFKREASRILKEVEEELGWMYETLHTDGKIKGRINYTVWSDVFACSECGKEIIFVQEALDTESGSIRETFPCPHCGVESSKTRLTLLYESVPDKALGKIISLPKRVPVLINYTARGTKYEKKPDKDDLELLKKIANLPLPARLPTLELPDMQMRRVGRMQPANITHIHHFFLPRATHVLSGLWELATSSTDRRLKNMLLFFVEQAIWGMSVLARYVPTHYSQVNQYLSGVFYVASQIVDPSPWYILDGKLKRLVKAFESHTVQPGQAIVTTQDLSKLGLADNSVDYVFTDPPFGENIYYSDLNILVESWHGVRTAPALEAIVDRVKEKTLLDYQRMMSECFSNYYRVLKPGRWMTVEFHNSRNSVWNAIQEALQHAGFVVADVRTLDKKQGSFQQVVSGNTVKRDLIISAYKPNGGLEERFQVKAGTEEAVWDFVTNHLRQLPVFVAKVGKAEPVTERQSYLLYDRMVAFHVQRGYPVPLSSPDFHFGLRQRFPARDGMYFLPEQVTEYDRQRLEVKEVEQIQLFVSDEKSAIQWVRLQLAQQPRTFKDLQPIYMKEAQQVWEKHEQPLELRTILEQNFVEEDDGAWRIPDPRKESDLEQIRGRALMKEFQQYLDSKGKLKVVRTEAVRAGFKEYWQKQDYSIIVQMVKRLPETLVQEDPALLMYYDNALMRTGE